MPDYFLPRKEVSLKEAFPSIKKINVTCEIEDWGYTDIKEWQRIKNYTIENIERKIPCPNPRCKRGGLDLQEIIFNLESSKIPSYEANYPCRGDEGTEKGRKKGDPCFVYFKIKIDISYKTKKSN